MSFFHFRKTYVILWILKFPHGSQCKYLQSSSRSVKLSSFTDGATLSHIKAEARICSHQRNGSSFLQKGRAFLGTVGSLLIKYPGGFDFLYSSFFDFHQPELYWKLKRAEINPIYKIRCMPLGTGNVWRQHTVRIIPFTPSPPWAPFKRHLEKTLV